MHATSMYVMYIFVYVVTHATECHVQFVLGNYINLQLTM
jgi:hypothetical protein